MSDSNTNVEIEDVLSSIRRLVSEDRSGARPGPPGEAVPDAPMLEDAAPVESATITPFQPRSFPVSDRPAAPQAPETRIDAAIVALNAETDESAVPMPDTDAGQPVAAPDEVDAMAEGELVAASEMLPVSYRQAGAKGAQFVLTADFLVETATDNADGLPEAAEDDVRPAEARQDPDVPAAGPSAMSDTDPAQARADQALDALVSGDALLASFGSVGAPQPSGGIWDADGLVDLAPRPAPRTHPLHPTLEATIADLEMAVAAQSEEFEPDLGEDMGGEPSSLAGAEFGEPPSDSAVAEEPDQGWTETDDAVGPVAADPADGSSRVAWDAAEASLEASRPVRRHRFHLGAEAEPAPATGYIGISDAFPAEGMDSSSATSLADDAPNDADAGPEGPTAYGEEFSDLDLSGPAIDLEQAGDVALFGHEGGEDAGWGLDPETGNDGRAGEAEGYPDPTIGIEDEAGRVSGPDDLVRGDGIPDPAAPETIAPARRIFIAPRVDLAAVDEAADAPDPGPDGLGHAGTETMVDDIAATIVQAATATIASATAQELAGHPAEDLPDTDPGSDPFAGDDAALPPSAEMWQPGAAQVSGDEDVAGDALSSMTTDALRGLVLELIRQELQGALGERITRNVRKLVRREISRALENRDLD